jgi:hypothetical protein
VSTARLYFEAVVAIMIMLALSVISGFLAAAITDDRTAVLATMVVLFVATGAIRVWRSESEAGQSDQPDT